MKMLPLLRHGVLFALLPVLVWAHPGHDGPHDFEWDLGHLAGHPLATLAYVALLATAVWGIRRVMSSDVAKRRR